MKLLKSDPEKLVFHFSKQEKTLLLDLLKLYPQIPASHARLSKSSPDERQKENQKLLEESLAAHREETRKQLLAMVEAPARWKETGAGWHFTLDVPQVETLLQAINDIRVGSWLALGCPDEKKGSRPALTAENVRRFWTLEVCGRFEMVLLQALEGAEGDSAGG